MAAKYSLELDGRLAVVQPPDTKPLLVRLRQHRRDLRGVLQTAHPAEPEITVQPDEILSVFPHERPIYGRVYKVDVEPFIRRQKLPPWGNISYFRELTKSEQRNLERGLQIVQRRFIRRHKLDFLLPMLWEIRNPRGKQIGCYHAPHKDRDAFTEIMPVSFITDPSNPDGENSGPGYIARIVCHELSHPLWQLYLPDRIKARWVRLYCAFANVQELTVGDLHHLRLDFINSKHTVGKYRKELNDEGVKLPFDAVLSWIKDIHHLTPKFIDLLVSQGDDMARYWPRTKLHLSELKIPVTKYSGKNPEELFCESNSLSAIGNKLPKMVQRLVKRSLRAVQPK